MPTVTNIVLVHGARADGSSWSKIIPFLQNKGLNVSAVQKPLTSIADDVAATNRIINAQDGPVLLAAHSYGGAVRSREQSQSGVMVETQAATYGSRLGTPIKAAVWHSKPSWFVIARTIAQFRPSKR